MYDRPLSPALSHEPFQKRTSRVPVCICALYNPMLIDASSTLAPWPESVALATPTCWSMPTAGRSSSSECPFVHLLSVVTADAPSPRQLDEPQNGTDTLQPWHLNYLGGSWVNATQCSAGGSNGYDAMHIAYADGLYNKWIEADGAWGMGYYKREDVPTHWDIVEGWTILDNNYQSALTPTDPNRCFWFSGSINVPGSPANPNGTGGAMLDNTASYGMSTPGSPPSREKDDGGGLVGK